MGRRGPDADGRVRVPAADGRREAAHGDANQQEKLNAEAEAAILKATPDPRYAAGWPQTRESQAGRKAQLARHLARYTARNTRDYFIHKDLGRFLDARAGLLPEERSAEGGRHGVRAGPAVRRYALRVKTIRRHRAENHRLPGADRGFPAPAVGEAQVRGAERLLRDPRPRAAGDVRRNRGQRPPAGRMARAVRAGIGAGR